MSETDSMAHFGGKASPPPPPKPLAAGGGAIVTLFLDSDLDTRFAMAVAADSTISDLKSQVALEHAAAFPDLGPVVVKAFEQEVMKGKKKKGKMYRLADSKLEGEILNGKPGRHIMHVKMDPCRWKSSQASIGGEDAGARVAVHTHDLHPPVAEASQALAMAASPLPPKPLSAGGGAILTLWIMTDLCTHHALPVAADSTISDLKSQVAREHFAAFRKLGPVVVKSFQKEVFPQEEVMKGTKKKGKKKKGIMYHLCDSILRSDVVNGKPDTEHFLHVKMAAAGKHSGFDPQRQAQVDAVEAQNGMAPAAAATDMHHAGHPLPRNAPREFVKKTMCEVCKVQLDGPADIPRHIRNHRLIRLDFLRGSAGNLLNQLLGIGGLIEGQSYGNPQVRSTRRKLNDSITPNPENPPNGAVGESTVPAAAVADGVSKDCDVPVSWGFLRYSEFAD